MYRYTQAQDIIFYIHIFPPQASGLRPESPAFISTSTVLSQKSTYNPAAAELQTSQDSCEMKHECGGKDLQILRA